MTIDPDEALRAADSAVALREITRSVAQRLGERASFTPIRDPENVGNGVHIHMSFTDTQGVPLTYDANGPAGMPRFLLARAIGLAMSDVPAIDRRRH